MAVLGKIRKRVGLVIGFVGVSLILFILGDVVTSNSGLFQQSSDVVGEIGSEKVHFQEFEKRVESMVESYKTNSKTETIDQNTQDMLREQTWGLYVNENVLGKEYDKLGLTCGPDELYEMCTGNNPNPQVKQAFTDPNTGQFSSTAVINFLKDLPNREEEIQRQWRTFEDAIREERVAEKYKNMIRLGLNTTSEEAKRYYDEAQRFASIRYIRMDLNSIPDADVKIEDSDLKEYYNANKEKYKQEETVRKVEYVSFDVVASAEDRTELENWVNNKKTEFTDATDNKLFVNQNSDTPFDSTFYAKGSLRPEVDSILFASSPGIIVGPLEDNNSLKMWKLNETKIVSDSVKARHILLKIENNDTAGTVARADSLKSAIMKGSKFDALAKSFSQDAGSAIKGGDLGWFKPGMMVPEFNDASFNGKKGDLPIVTTQFGVHLIQILEKSAGAKQIQVAVLERKIVPSQATYDIMYNKAGAFAANNLNPIAFDSSIVKSGYNKRIADNIKESDKNIPGLEQPREFIRWAYTAKKGEISRVFTIGDKYVVAHLVDIREKGYLPMEAVKDQITAEVRKQKKADMLVEKINNANATSIDALAQKLNVTANDAENISMSNPYLPGIGNEPKVVGTIFTLKAGQLSKPVKGDNAVTVLSIKEFKEPAPAPDLSPTAKQIADQRKNRSDYEVFNALKEKAEIVDNRGKFY